MTRFKKNTILSVRHVTVRGREKSKVKSGYDFFDEMTVHVGQTHVASAETESASGMVYAKEMKHGGMKIVDVISIFDRLVSKVVRTAHTDTLLYATSGKPHGETEGIVVAPIGSLSKGVLPNSPPQTIKVESKRPSRRRSVIKAAIG